MCSLCYLLSTVVLILDKALLTDTAKWFSIATFLDSYDIPFTVEERDNVRYMSSAGMCGHVCTFIYMYAARLCVCVCVRVCVCVQRAHSCVSVNTVPMCACKLKST